MNKEKNNEKKNLVKKEEQKTDLKDKMLSDDDLSQVSGGLSEHITKAKKILQ